MNRQILFVTCILAMARFGIAQKSNTQTVQLDATVESSLTVSIDQAAVKWSTGTGNSLQPGNSVNRGNTGVSVTTSWRLAPNITKVKLFAYFTTTNALVGTGQNAIPSQNFEIQAGSGNFMRVDQNLPGYGVAAVQLQETVVTDTNRNGTQNTNLTFTINLGSLPQLASDSYTGRLYLQAEAMQ